MISTSYKFIFSHIPKCAGTSILNTLREIDGGTTCEDINKEPHVSFERYMKQFPGEFDSFYKFCFVRNPFDRCVSLFHYRRKYSKQTTVYKHWPSTHEIENMSFKQMVLKHVKNTDPNTQYLVPGCLDGHWLSDHMLERVNHVGRFERLQHDFNIICDNIGIKRHQLPHDNKTTHKHYTEYYDDTTREIVEKLYKRDIDHFGYKFGE